MSKTVGIIAEYNPFHNGNLHHLLKSKEILSLKQLYLLIYQNHLYILTIYFQFQQYFVLTL